MQKKFMCSPLDMIYVTQKFGENPEMYKRFKMEGHNGVDFRTKFNDSPTGCREVFCVDNGEVIFVARNEVSGYGWHVKIRHDDGSITLYAHLCKILVNVGDKISAGECFAITGNTGYSTGHHLHFGYRPADIDYDNGFLGYVDPLDFLDFKNDNSCIEVEKPKKKVSKKKKAIQKSSKGSSK